MIKVDKWKVEVSGAYLDLLAEVGVAVSAIADIATKAGMPYDTLRDGVLDAVNYALNSTLDEGEEDDKPEDKDALDGVADLLAALEEALEKRRGGRK